MAVRVTSKETYAALKASGALKKKQWRVYNELYQRVSPLTGSELNHCLRDPSAHKRLSELKRMGVVAEGEKRRCAVTGRPALTWYTTDSMPVPPEPKEPVLELVVRKTGKGVEFRGEIYEHVDTQWSSGLRRQGNALVFNGKKRLLIRLWSGSVEFPETTAEMNG